MATSNLDRNFGFLVHDVARLLRKEYDRRVRRLGLTRSQWRVVAHLYRNEGVTQTELADILEIEDATLAGLLDRLEAAGWVERRPCERDRRANRLHLTERPSAVVGEMFRISAALKDDALVGLPPADQEHLIDALLVVKRNLTDLMSLPAEREKRVAVGD